ncbi:phage holin family protein [Fuerstiella marisgermanici]|uniref:Phage holin family protein n=1 Tax=Fuerstiella marisgermanici TaxID=1891926 RepID=A0A1P8WJC8_9PLAN|nr:phage holin family protein [Fuerstiella marisgermanici]APZ94169.1 hypothetical protein Fuma_03793 [Fuerstiella marisgermanici]
MITQQRSAPTDGDRASSKQKPPRQRGIGALLHDAIALIELQGKLFVHDLHQLKSGSGPALLMLALGVILAFATVPVLLLGLGWMLASLADWPVWLATVTVAAVGGVVPALGLLIIGWKTLLRKSSVVTRSTTELKCNTDWLKRRLKSM